LLEEQSKSSPPKALKRKLPVKIGRYDRWVGMCWFAFFINSVWLLTRIVALQTGTNFLKIGPNDEAVAIVFLLFIALALILANETLRRFCEGIPLRQKYK
jgi:DMSO/TMAO reductase YedYZ heme-binding membrane subunit